MNVIKIAQMNNRYVLENVTGKLHIMNKQSLTWNLKNVFGLTGIEVLTLFVMLEDKSSIEVDLADFKVAA